MDTERFEQARQARDPRFDGRFFIGVKTTGIYCRPICRVKIPMARNVTFFETAAAAAEAGFRPCLRCRPETSPGTPAWMGTSTTVNRALRLISEGALDGSSVELLSDRLGVTSRHLSRLFSQHLGASPKAVAQTRRLHFAKKLIDETSLSMIEIALSSGYSSVRRFNDHFKAVYERSPTSVRNKSQTTAVSGFRLKLAYRPPFDFAGILNFLKVRAIPGVEFVTDETYARTIVVGGEVGRLTVADDTLNLCLCVQIDLEEAHELFTILERVKRLFDLTADPIEILHNFSNDPQLGSIVNENPGQRVPGSWDPFEIAVRAIVGQQVSVKGATTVMGRIAKTFGNETDMGLCFPTPAQLAELDPATLSMPRKRAQAIKDLSHAVLIGQIDFDNVYQPSDLVSQLVEIKGIGQWTAQYIAMRAINDPDAFLHNDLVLLKVAKHKLNIESDRALLERSQDWRPWRAYAGMHLWRQAAKLE